MVLSTTYQRKSAGKNRVLVRRRLEDKNESLSLGSSSLCLGLGLEEKILQFFQDFCCNSWRQWAPWHYEVQQKQFAIRKPLFERTLCALCTSASVERVFSNRGYLLGHTGASKAHCQSLPTSHHPTYGERLLVTNCCRPWKCILIGQCTRTSSIIHHLALSLENQYGLIRLQLMLHPSGKKIGSQTL